VDVFSSTNQILRFTREWLIIYEICIIAILSFSYSEAEVLAAIQQWVTKTHTLMIVTYDIHLFSIICNFWCKSWSSQDICQTVGHRLTAFECLICPTIFYSFMIISEFWRRSHAAMWCNVIYNPLINGSYYINLPLGKEVAMSIHLSSIGNRYHSKAGSAVSRELMRYPLRNFFIRFSDQSLQNFLWLISRQDDFSPLNRVFRSFSFDWNEADNNRDDWCRLPHKV
jgi:hypothetical protein